MSHVIRRLPALILGLLAVLLLPLAATAGAATPKVATQVSPAVRAAVAAADTGKYFVFRTRDTNKPATNEQNTRCNRYFGLRAIGTVTRLNALLFAYGANPATGRIQDQTKSLLGPGFICAVPLVGKADGLEAYAYSSLPGPGLVEGNGGCNLAPVAVANLPLLLNCQLAVKPNANGVTGGLITSNSLVNTLNRSDTAPTGSVWTAHVVGNAPVPSGPGGAVPPGITPETPGLDFFTFRTRDEVVKTSSPDCRKAGTSEKVLAVREANLAVAEPDPVSGQVPETLGASVGKLVVCYPYATNEGHEAVALATLRTATGTFEVKARGECKAKKTVVSTALLAQGCSLTVSSGGQRGLVTTNGLIEKGKPASAANAAVWTFALFGAPPAG